MKRFLPCAVVVLSIISCGNPAPAPESKDTVVAAPAGMAAPSMTEKNKATALLVVQSFSNHDTAAMFKVTAADFIDYGDGNMPPMKGLDSAKAGLRQFLAAFPDIKGENLMVIAEGNQAAVFGDWSGTFKGELMGIKPTGKTFKFKDVDLFTFNDEGMVTSHRSIQSTDLLFKQVGAKMK